MATAYQLVPLAWLKNQQGERPKAKADPIMRLLDDDDEQAFPLAKSAPKASEDVLSLLSPRFHKRARILLRFAQMAGATIDDYQRMVYANGQLGSTLYELLTYAMLTPALRKNVAEPIDYVDFMRTLDSVHCPRNLYARVEPSLLTGRRHTQSSSLMTSRPNRRWFVMK